MWLPLITMLGILWAQDPTTEVASPKLPPRAEDRFRRPIPRMARTSEMIFIGKAHCSVNRSVDIPFPGIITAVEVRTGQAVRQGDVLARLRPSSDAVQQIQGRTIPARGKDLSEGNSNREMSLKAPINGHVIWIHPDVQVGQELSPATPVLKIGVMDPMILRANVYESEVLRLEAGDEVLVYPESLPETRLKARVSRISWSPLTLDLLQPSYYEVEFGIQNPNLVLREGLRVIIYLYKPLPIPISVPAK
jgi:hypothetical protein